MERQATTNKEARMHKKAALILIPALLLAACGDKEPTKQDFIDNPELMEKHAEQCGQEYAKGMPTSELCKAMLEAQQEMIGTMLQQMMQQMQEMGEQPAEE